MKEKATANRPVGITGCIFPIYRPSLGTWVGFQSRPSPSPDHLVPEGCFLCFCALLKSFYSATPFHLVHVLFNLYSRAHTYASGDGYISALLHSSEQDSDRRKVINKNAHHLAVKCASCTHSYIIVEYFLSMSCAF